MQATERKLFLERIKSTLQLKSAPLPAEGQHDRVERALQDFEYFASTYFPHYVTDICAPFHLEMVKEMEEVPAQGFRVLAYAAPRGFAKSVIVTLLYHIWLIVRKACHFIVIVAANEDLASEFSEAIRLEFDYNKALAFDWNPGSARGEVSDFIVNSIRVLAKGKAQGIRGVRHAGWRPDRLICDDLEKDQEANNPVSAKKTIKLIWENFLPALDIRGSVAVMVGTIIKKRCAFDILMNGQEAELQTITRRVYRAIEQDANGNDVSLWASRWPLSLLYSYREKLGTASFEKEYQMNPREEEDSMFHESWFRFYNPGDYKMSELIVAGFVDPSARSQKKHDPKAIVWLGLERNTMTYLILDAWIKKTNPRAMVFATFQMFELYQSMVTVVGIESNGFQALLADNYDAYEKEAGITMPLQLVEHYQAKEDRVETLCALFERGKMLLPALPFQSEGVKELITQLLYFPSTVVHDDGPDALEGAYSLLKNTLAGKTTFLPVKRRNKDEMR
jgi:predicted phage terminase large subunit-like protein